MIKLSCKSCGAKLELTEDIDRFSCASCGAEWIVQRGGGVVSLKGVEEGIKSIEGSTGVLAAEVKIKALEEHLQELLNAMNGVCSVIVSAKNLRDFKTNPWVIGAILLPGWLLTIAAGSRGTTDVEFKFFLCLMIVASIIVPSVGYLLNKDADKKRGNATSQVEALTKRKEYISAQIEDTRKRIADHRRQLIS